MEFASLKTTQKGDIGEEIVKHILRKKGATVYKPADENNSHLIDFIAIKNKTATAIDIKTKPKREYYNDTGIDFADFVTYIALNQSIRVAIFFVDEKQKAIYGNYLDELIKPIYLDNAYPLISDATLVKVIYFPLCNMKKIHSLTNEQCTQISELSGRNNKYDKE